jgi:hypothetical protein
MQIILSDHNCEGHSEAIFMALRREDWLDMIPIELKWFEDVGLSPKAPDETVWRFCQQDGYLLLTGNRTANDRHKSLEFTIRRLVTPESLPVLTIGNLGAVLGDPDYCLRCAVRLLEIVLDLENLRGITRLFLPGQA